MKPTAGRQIADFNPAAQGFADINKPVFDAAVNLDRAHHPFRGRGLQVALQLQNTQGGAGGMPLLSQRRLGPANAGSRDLPEGMEPVRATDHDHNAIAHGAGAATVLRACLQILGPGDAVACVPNPL